MFDQLIIGDKASFDDFRASLATRKIGMPPKKTIRETVPFSNETYDFSRINGELYWEERELEYVFEITANTPERLEEYKAAFADWVLNVFEEKIFDPFVPDHHFLGTYDDMSFEDDESLEKTTASVKFKAYPYKIANTPTVFSVDVPAMNEKTLVVLNGSSHRITPTITASAAFILKYGNDSYASTAGTFTDSQLMLGVGVNEVRVQNGNEGESLTLSISFHEEVF